MDLTRICGEHISVRNTYPLTSKHTSRLHSDSLGEQLLGGPFLVAEKERVLPAEEMIRAWWVMAEGEFWERGGAAQCSCCMVGLGHQAESGALS